MTPRHEINIDKTVGLIRWKDDTFVLYRRVREWCEDVLGAIPEVVVLTNKTGSQVKTSLVFESESDEILFRMAFAQYWHPHVKHLFPILME